MNDQYLPMTLDHMLKHPAGQARRRAARAWYSELQQVFSHPEGKGDASDAK